MTKIKRIELNKIFSRSRPSIHFIGIGGKGLNGIAKICIKKGWQVSGSDRKKTEETQAVEKIGGKVFYNHKASNIDIDIDLIVRTSIVKNNPEINRANILGIPIVKRSEFLGFLVRGYKSVSVAGSHGKSTTTALVGLALQFAGLDPTIFGGAYIKEIGAYERLGKGKYCVVEACEYDKSFFDLVGDIGIITSIEKSHMEYYKNEKKMLRAFQDFVSKFKRGSILIANGDDLNIRKTLNYAKGKVRTFGFNASNDYVIKNERYYKHCSVFDVYRGDDEIIKDLKIKVPGFYNILNFTSSVVLFHMLGLDLSRIKELGETFSGVGRRFEIMPVNKDLVFVDDFCHHPSQVKNLFRGLKQFFPDRKVMAIFQPRQFHLIKTFIKEYGESFKDADNIIVTDIVPALGDTAKDKTGLNAFDIVSSIGAYSYKNQIKYLKKFSDVVEEINKLNDKFVVATIGAGDVHRVREMYLLNTKV